MTKIMTLPMGTKRQGPKKIAHHGTNSWIKVKLEHKKSLIDIDMHDFNENSVEFNLSYNKKIDKLFEFGNEITLRFYFNKKHYIPLKLRLIRFEPNPNKKDLQQFKMHGHWDKSWESYYTLFNLVGFLRSSNGHYHKEAKKA